MIRRLVFALPELSVNLMFASINGWFLFYLVSVLGLAPLLAGLAFLIGRLVDAVLDIVVGRWSDRLSERGLRVRMIGLALPLAGVSYTLLWALPARAGSDLGMFVVATLAFAGFTLFYTLVAVPRLALLAGYAPGPGDRVRQVATDMTLAYVAVAIATSAFPEAVSALSPRHGETNAWSITAAIIALSAALFYLPFLFRVRDTRLAPAAPDPLSIGVGVRRLRVAGLVRPLLLFGLLVLGPFLLQSILPFYLQAHAGLPPGRQLPVLGTVFGAALLAFPIWSAMARRHSAPTQTRAALLMLACAVLTMPVLPQGLSPGLLGMAALCGLGLSGLSLAAWDLVPAMVVRVQGSHAAPGEGLTTAAFTFVNKLAVGIAALINGAMIWLADFGLVSLGWGSALPALLCLAAAGAMPWLREPTAARAALPH